VVKEKKKFPDDAENNTAFTYADSNS